MNPWYCLDCHSCMNLDIHGRCEVCGSNSVDVSARPVVVAPEMEILKALEELWLLN